jgi:hypothetical protein
MYQDSTATAEDVQSNKEQATIAAESYDAG